ncbi:unnamed protein product, partial [Meganyctiphanes norvegica]
MAVKITQCTKEGRSNKKMYRPIIKTRLIISPLRHSNNYINVLISCSNNYINVLINPTMHQGGPIPQCTKEGRFPAPITISMCYSVSIPLQIPQCPKDGVIIGNQCLFLGEERTNWEDAQQKCEATHHAANIHIIQSKGDYAYWVGGSDLATEGTWLWSNGIHVDVDQLPWWSGNPSSGARQDCLMVVYDGYYDFPCTYGGFRYICELGLARMEDPSGLARMADPKADGSTRKTNASCVAPWVYGGNSSGCFLFVQKSLDWDSARTYCLDNGGDLIIIDKDTKRSDIVNHYELSGMINQYIWIGGNDRTGYGLTLWNNGNPVKNVFNYGLLNDEFGQNMCMFTDIYGHHDPRVNFCSHSMPNFICEDNDLNHIVNYSYKSC